MKIQSKYKNILLELICFLFILLFVYAALNKFLVFDEFVIQIGQSPVLTAYAGWVAWVVPSLEILIAIMLVILRFRLLALYAAFSLMVMFTTYIVIILNFSDYIPCSCGGVLEKLGWTEHLIFNIGFVILAFIGIMIMSSQKKEASQNFSKSTIRKIYKPILICVIGCIGFVTLLFTLSERGLHRDNSFTRRFPGHPAIKHKELDLKYNSYYIAGTDKGQIYLGNTQVPLHLAIVDTSLQEKQDIRLALDQDSLPFRRIQVMVIPPYFFLADGMVPYIGRGHITDWKAQSIMKTSAYFTNIEAMDSTNLVIRSVSSKTKENILGKINVSGTGKVDLSYNLLQKQVDGIFDTDGILQYNRQLQKLVYTYFYRNQYIVADNDLQVNLRGKTIDTISQAQIKVGTIASKNQKKLAAPALLVNKNSATYENYLFVNSKLVGRYEPIDIWEQASIIDVYDLVENTYEFSFYVYNIGKERLKSFQILNDKFIGLIGHHIVTYRLDTNRFKNLLPPSNKVVDLNITDAR